MLGLVGDIRVADWMAFMRQWMRHPVSTASIVPSGRQLGRLMACEVPRSAQRVVEIGAGTGSITRSLLASGISTESLIVVEFNEAMCRHLRRRFPCANVVCADARDLVSVVESSVGFRVGQVDAVVSSLGLLSMSRLLQLRIFEAAFRVMRRTGTFVQFTYGPSSPLDSGVCMTMNLQVSRGAWAWCNLPPARVYSYARVA